MPQSPDFYRESAAGLEAEAVYSTCLDVHAIAERPAPQPSVKTTKIPDVVLRAEDLNKSIPALIDYID